MSRMKSVSLSARAGFHAAHFRSRIARGSFSVFTHFIFCRFFAAFRPFGLFSGAHSR